MPLRDFFGYLAHSLRFSTPHQRQEMYMAKISWLIATTMGGFKGGFEDFILFKDADSKAEKKRSRKKRTSQSSKSATANNPFKDFKPANKKG